MQNQNERTKEDISQTAKVDLSQMWRGANAGN
jgi:hypothetical protein